MSEHVKSVPEWPMLLVRTLIGIEQAAMVAIAALLVYDILTQPALSIATSIALLVLAIIAAAFLAAIVVGLGKSQTWTRGAAIVWQVLQTAAAVLVLQGDIAPAVGWGLAFVALAVLVLLFHPAVTERLRHR